MSGPSYEDSTLHVRGVGGPDLEADGALQKLFERFGRVVQATVRHREDDKGNNTSWALVTMATKAGAQRALSGSLYNPSTGAELNVNLFSKKQADASTGGMKATRQTSRLREMAQARRDARKRRALLKVKVLIWFSGARGLQSAATNGGMVKRESAPSQDAVVGGEGNGTVLERLAAKRSQAETLSESAASLAQNDSQRADTASRLRASMDVKREQRAKEKAVAIQTGRNIGVFRAEDKLANKLGAVRAKRAARLKAAALSEGVPAPCARPSRRNEGVAQRLQKEAESEAELQRLQKKEVESEAELQRLRSLVDELEKQKAKILDAAVREIYSLETQLQAYHSVVGTVEAAKALAGKHTHHASDTDSD